jgi:hypothetical protein
MKTEIGEAGNPMAVPVKNQFLVEESRGKRRGANLRAEGDGMPESGQHIPVAAGERAVAGKLRLHWAI